jgi:hypothetical protein
LHGGYRGNKYEGSNAACARQAVVGLAIIAGVGQVIAALVRDQVLVVGGHRCSSSAAAWMA